jgi:hypothetical protein
VSTILRVKDVYAAEE